MKNKLLLLFLFAGFLLHGMCHTELSQDLSEGNEFVQESELKAFVLFLLSKRVLVYHSTGSEQHLNSIIKNGLMSHLSLLDKLEENPHFFKDFPGNFRVECIAEARRIIAAMPDSRFVKDMSQIYFAPEGSAIGVLGNLHMFVNQEETYVFNGIYKQNCDPFTLFKSSRVLLKDYLDNVQEAKKIQRDNPDWKVYLDPQTSKPQCLKSQEDFEQFEKEKKYGYVAEIPFNSKHIPAYRLHVHQDKYYG